MMKTALPLGPLLLILLSAAIIIAALPTWWKAPKMHEMLPLPLIDERVEGAEVESIVVNDLNSARQSVSVILSSSGFAKSRNRFSRTGPPEPARQPELKPKFVGQLGSGDDTRIMIVWRNGEEAKVHAVGDRTPWGELVEISSSEAIFANPSGRRQLKFF